RPVEFCRPALGLLRYGGTKYIDPAGTTQSESFFDQEQSRWRRKESRVPDRVFQLPKPSKFWSTKQYGVSGRGRNPGSKRGENYHNLDEDAPNSVRVEAGFLIEIGLEGRRGGGRTPELRN